MFGDFVHSANPPNISLLYELDSAGRAQGPPLRERPGFFAISRIFATAPYPLFPQIAEYVECCVHQAVQNGLIAAVGLLALEDRHGGLFGFAVGRAVEFQQLFLRRRHTDAAFAGAARGFCRGLSQ